MEHVKNIGDIDVYSNEHFARVTVDGETVLTIPRVGHGLDELAEVLKSLTK